MNSGGLTFVKTFPDITSHNDMFMLEAMTYKVTIETPEYEVSPDDITVQVWTNQYHAQGTEGVWHSIDLEYCEIVPGNCRHYVYGKSVVITSVCDFNFTFRMRFRWSDEWIWCGGWKKDGFAHVNPPRDGDKWTQGPDFTRITGAVHLGNFIAATNAPYLRFTHVLNCAEDRDMIYPDNNIDYLKVPMKDGSSNCIDPANMVKAVEWLKKHDKRNNKILVNCRAGIGRAGSVVVAYVYGNNPEMSFDDAYQYVFKKRYVYPHKGVKEMLPVLFRS